MSVNEIIKIIKDNSVKELHGAFREAPCPKQNVIWYGRTDKTANQPKAVIWFHVVHAASERGKNKQTPQKTPCPSQF